MDEIEQAVIKTNSTIEFTKIAEAREYRESANIRENRSKKPIEIHSKILEEMPLTI